MEGYSSLSHRINSIWFPISKFVSAIKGKGNLDSLLTEFTSSTLPGNTTRKLILHISNALRFRLMRSNWFLQTEQLGDFNVTITTVLLLVIFSISISSPETDVTDWGNVSGSLLKSMVGWINPTCTISESIITGLITNPQFFIYEWQEPCRTDEKKLNILEEWRFFSFDFVTDELT